MNTRHDTVQYMREMVGVAPRLTSLPKSATAAVPVFLMNLYDLLETTLFDRRIILAIARDYDDEFTPSEYAGHAEQIRDALGEIVALVLPHVAAYDRNRMVKHGVAFIVPGRQLFLPQILVDLREHFPRRRQPAGDTLSYPAQTVVLYHLLKEPVEQYSLRDLAKRLHYSAMTLSNVGNELTGLKLCTAVVTGRKRTLHFNTCGRKLWKQVLPYLRSPVKAHRWVRGNIAGAKAVRAGISALSAYTDIADDALPTYAVRDNQYRKKLEAGDLLGCHGPDEAEAGIELWHYSPDLLAEDARADPLSLFVSLHKSPDERVTKALREMLEGVQW